MEKRHFTRVDYHVHAEVTIDGTTFPVDVENLSLKGMLARSERDLPYGSLAGITISLPDVSPPLKICLDAKVVRREGDEVGFAFDRIELESFTHLRNIISIYNGDADSVMDEFAHFVEDKVHEEDERDKTDAD